MPGSGKHNVNNIDSFFKVRPSRTTIREGETISFLENGNLVKQEKRNGVVYETVYVEQGTKKQEETSVSSASTSSAAGDITSVTAGTGLTGGGVSGPVTLDVVGGTGITANANDIAIDSTVVTLTGTQTLTNKTLTTPALGTPASGVMTNVTGTASGLTSGKVTVTDSTANTNFPVVFHNESNALLDDTSALTYNPSSGTLVVPNLNVSGTTTTVNTTNLVISDKLIELSNGATGTPAAEADSGLIIERGDSTNVFIGWDEGSDRVRFATTSSTGSSSTVSFVSNANIQAGRLYGDVTGDVTGNADTATKWANPIEVSLTGDITGVTGASGLDGSADISIATTIANDSVALGAQTTGNYMQNVSAGTGISVSHTPSEGSTATISTNDSAIVHNNLNGYVANEHIDWTTDQGAINIHAGNYTDTNQLTTFVIQDGDTTNVTISQGKYVKFQALTNGGLDIDWASSLGAGSSGDPYDLQFKIDLSNMGALVDTLESGDNLLVYNADEGTALAPVSEIQSALNIPSASGTTDGVVTLNANGSLTGESELTYSGGLLDISGSVYSIIRLNETDVTNNPAWWTVADGGNYSIRLNNTGTYPFQITTNASNNAVDSITLGYSTSILGNLTLNDSLTIGSGGNYAAGSIYSDSNWGMLFRAKQASPTLAEFRWANSADSELMRIDTSGNVGIGNNSPSRPLQIGTTTTNGEAIKLDGNASYGASIYYSRGGGYNWNAGVGGASSSASNIPASYWGVEDVSQGNAVRLAIAHTTGNVGIGTNSPSNTFEVKSGSTTPFGIKNASNSTRLQVSLTNDDADIFLYDRNGTLQTALRSEGDTYFNQGNVGIGVSNPDSPLHIGNNVATSAGFDSFADYQILLYDTGTSTTSYGMGIRANTFMFNSDVDFEWRSDNSAKMFLDGANGRLGIGTVSPGEKLEVNGSIALSNNTYFKARNSVGALVPLFRLNSSNHIEIINGNSTNGDIIFKDASDTNMTIKGDTGYVGIGTNTPVTNLHISSGSAQTDNDGMLKVEQTSTSSGSAATNAGINIKNYHGTSQFLQWEEHGLRIGSRILTNSGTGDVVFTAGADSEKMRILAGGNVGIGITNPASLLTVNGTARFNTATGSDPFWITRQGNTNESLRIYVDDSSAVFQTFQDETSGDRGNFVFVMDSDSTAYTDFRHGSATKMRIGSSGNIGINQGSRLYLDGTALTGDTYIVSPASDAIDILAGSNKVATLTSTSFEVSPGTSNIDFIVDDSSGVEAFKVESLTGNTTVANDLTVSGTFALSTLNVTTIKNNDSPADTAMTIDSNGRVTFSGGPTISSGGINVTGASTMGAISMSSGNLSNVADIDLSGVLYMDSSALIDASRRIKNLGSSLSDDVDDSVHPVDFANVTTPGATGWYTICKASAANARGGGIININATGGSLTPQTITIDFFVEWQGYLVRCNVYGDGGNGGQFTKVRLIETASTTELQVYVNTTVAQGVWLSFEKDRYNPNYSLLDPWATATPTVTGDEILIKSASFYANGNKTDALTIQDSARRLLLGRDSIKSTDLSGSTTQLYINSNTTFSGTVTTGGQLNIEDTNALIYRNSGQMELITYGGYNIDLNPSGDVRIDGASLYIPVGERLYFGGGNHTYIGEDVDDRLRFFVGGDEFMRFTQQDAGGEIFSIYQDVYLPDDKKIHFGGGDDLKIYHYNAAGDSRINVANNPLLITYNDVDRFRLASNDLVINEGGGDYNFRVEGDTDANLLFVDAGTDRVGIGTASPGALLDVDGRIKLTSSGVLQWGSAANYGNLTWDGDSAIVQGQSGRDLDLRSGSSRNILFKIGSSEKMQLNSVGSFKLDGGGLHDQIASGQKRIVMPKGGASIMNSSPETGAIKIVLPVLSNNTMISMRIRVFIYAQAGTQGESFDVVCGGYNYQDGNWYNQYGWIVGAGDHDHNYKIRFGRDANNNIIYIGELTDTWAYPQIYVLDVQTGHVGYSDSDWHNAFSIGFESSAFSNLDSTILQGNIQRNVFSRNFSSAYYNIGNVGIGTTGPQRKLHVSTGNTDIAARFENTSSNGTVMELVSSGDSSTLYFQTDHIYGSGALYLGGGTNQNVYRGSSHLFQVGSGNTTNITLNSNQLLFAQPTRIQFANDQRIFDDGGGGLKVGAEAHKLQLYAGTSTQEISFLTGGRNGTERAKITNTELNVDGNLTLQAGHYFTAHNESSYQKYDMYAGNGSYCIGMYSGNSFGGLNDWAMTFTFYDSQGDRGFLWRSTGHSTSQGAMSLTTGGKLSVAHSTRIGYGISDTTTSGATYALDVSGSIGATADVVAYVSSDKRLKDNIKNIANPLEKLEKLNGVEFDWNDKQDLYKGHDIGVIAQEVEEVLPEIVDTREDGHKAVKYDRMVALLIEAVKEQQEQINELKEKLNG